MRDNVIVDIDGVLADYRLGLLYWIRQSYPSLAQKANEHIQKGNTWIDHSTMEIPFVELLNVLEMFRMSGGKQSIPVFPGAQKMLDGFKLDGYEIILLTSRPIDIYSNIYRDTVEWLRNNNLPYDMLLWSKSKAEMVFKMRLHTKVVLAIDDELRHIEDYKKLEVPTAHIDLYGTQAEVEDEQGHRIYRSLEQFLERNYS